MEENNKWVIVAAKVAQRLHKDQKDKVGVDYFSGHLSYVASLGKIWQEKVVGYLYDANEDTPNSIDSILMMLEEESKDTLLAPERDKISKALLLLNHHTAKNREEYIKCISRDPLAKAVKINDLTHNMDVRRLPHISPKDIERFERYRKEYAILTKDFTRNIVHQVKGNYKKSLSV